MYCTGFDARTVFAGTGRSLGPGSPPARANSGADIMLSAPELTAQSFHPRRNRPALRFASGHPNQRKEHKSLLVKSNPPRPSKYTVWFNLPGKALAQANIGDQEKVKDYVSKILSSSNHLLSLINDILDMSRIESGKVSLEETEVDLKEVFEDIRTIVSTQVSAKQLDLSISTSGLRNTLVYCDKVRLSQVILNLVSNALKFTPPGGKVFVTALQKENAPDGMGIFRISVKDTGIGMSPEFAQRIFEPFERERTSTVSRIQGTGLGMSIAKSIMDIMGGTIELITEEGVGSEFIMTLKLRLQDQVEVGENAAEGCASAAGRKETAVRGLQPVSVGPGRRRCQPSAFARRLSAGFPALPSC